MFLLLQSALAFYVERPETDEEVIKNLDDRTMRETIKKDRSAFVLFHADHQRVSDSAYLQYSSIAKKYKNASKFYVVPASVGQDVARTYGVVGYPFLFHFRYGTKTGNHFGRYTRSSIERFIANHTKIACLEINPTGSQGDVINQIANEYIDASAIVLVVSDSNNEFGKAADKLIDELAPFMPFARIKDEAKAIEIGFEAPSLILLRADDRQTVKYDGGADSDEMFLWIMHNSIPKFRPLNPQKLFSHDGVSLDAVIAMSYGVGSDDLFISLENITNQVPWLAAYYVDLTEMPTIGRMMNVTGESLVFVRANYSKIQFSVQSSKSPEKALDFEEDKLEMKTIEAPPSLYGYVRKITEPEFERLEERGEKFVVMFGSAFCSKCRNMRESYFDAAMALGRQGSKISFSYWDITEMTPSFSRDKDISVPSIFVVSKGDVETMEQYTGPTNFLSIIEWSSALIGKSDDADKMIKSELGSEFDEI
ncbi:hypothetical protein TVAG_401220 [Trichomonas vaginalis G3]|uniref:Thioredoxin domain-containing protein n=1 Tax=Trichomonas vaginalis (strain ATCC PRA-98 / G3) TaxID=412133 RepID=A2E3N0_TRIV3|nr:thioredoxin domain-containing protein 16 family [Trichomonas vaginalis G3]EAY12796.1 hypothetical protein TVAG_401220 [Trichomonas vaginalis G3]KAI5505580.1 thioredoxin domain-containing protein 16 family [Trichomonas vaginalis G3]|eukprot:XP_001325019.1 hypothetical protein [Trichomonas vaginalis G3]